MKKYDYILVGSGLYSGVFAWFAKQKGKKCLVLEKRDHIGGNVYCENTEGIHVHKYGAHIFHTSNKEVWQFVNSLAEFNRYTNSPVANYKGEMYNMPFKNKKFRFNTMTNASYNHNIGFVNTGGKESERNIEL